MYIFNRKFYTVQIVLKIINVFLKYEDEKKE